MKYISRIANTLQSAFVLFGKSYLKIFPFLICYGICSFGIDKVIPLSKKSISFISLLNNFMQLLLYILFFCFIMVAVYQYYKKEPFKYLSIISTGGKRFIPMFTAYLIAIFITLGIILGSFLVIIMPTVVPIISASALQGNVVLTDMLESLMIDFVKQLLLGFKLGFLEILSFSPLFLLNLVNHIYSGDIKTVEIIIIGICFAIVLYFFTAGAFIIDKNLSAWYGLKTSLRLIHQNWFITFVIVLIWGFTINILNWLLGHFIGSHSTQIIGLLTFSFGPCLMIVHCEKLLETSRTST